MTHNYTGYTNHGCRCEICTSANREHSRRIWAEMKSRRKDCSHYKMRNGGGGRDMCCRCGKTSKRVLAVAA